MPAGGCTGSRVQGEPGKPAGLSATTLKGHHRAPGICFREKVNTPDAEERPGMGDTAKEVKIARVLITISVIFGLFAVVTLLYIGIGGLAGKTVPGIFPAGALLLAAVKAAGTGFGLAAHRTITRGDLRRAGRYALVASLLPPLDLIVLFAGLLALFLHREGEAG